MGRAPCCEKVGLKRGRWTAEEDAILMRYIQENGEGSWRSLPKNAGLLRCGKSCRLRWINYLRGDVKRGDISPEEEEIIIKLHNSFGNRWSLIAGHLPGRTDNEIKNYWNSHLSRRLHSIRRLNDDGAPMVVDLGKIINGGCKRKGRIRRSAMKKKDINVEIRKGNPGSRAGDLSTTPLIKREASRAFSSKIEERGENKVTGPLQDIGVLVNPCEDRASGAVRPREYTESAQLGHNKAMGGGTRGTTEEIQSVAIGLIIDEKGNEVLGLNEETREKVGVGETDERNESKMGIEWCSSMDACFEEMWCFQEDWMSWEWDRVEEQREEDGGKIWSWLWESDNAEEGNFQTLEN